MRFQDKSVLPTFFFFGFDFDILDISSLQIHYEHLETIILNIKINIKR